MQPITAVFAMYSEAMLLVSHTPARGGVATHSQDSMDPKAAMPATDLWSKVLPE